ncbi:EPSP synthase-domain-containing protein [Paraphysoderma sedebokerense]|nr:EPSP synthase-domain-containing protein [Paraphysoderma sedebokerense]
MTMDTSNIIKIPILGSESILVGYDLDSYIVEEVTSIISASRYVLITDTNIAPHHLQPFIDNFAAIAPKSNLLHYIIPPGELSKSRATKALIEDYLLLNACTRDTCLVALGGGVIGDLVGYVAATFMRGVPFVQIPTTLLAMVDSSIGGKTAIDAPAGKNLIGAFWQPQRIYIDLKYLLTLPKREVVNGMAEVIKTAAIWSEKDFVLLENNADNMFAAIENGKRRGHLNNDESSLLQKIILGSARVKAEVVTADVREGGLRGLLNFGHTVGHAIEAILAPMMLHGECVSIGMIKEAEIARHLGHLSQVSVGRLTRCLVNYGLPVSLEQPSVVKLTNGKICMVDEMMKFMGVDKKNVGAQKKVVLLKTIGSTVEKKASAVEDRVIRNIIAPAVMVRPVSSPLPHYTIPVPGSKSISNRALVLASLGLGTCRLKNLLHSDDTQVMLNALQKLGACTYDWEDNGETLVVHGNGGKLHVSDSELYLGNAGTAARFLTTVAALVPHSSSSSCSYNILTGNARMKQRPIEPLVAALTANGTPVSYLEGHGCLPLKITAQNGLKGGTMHLSASISSQYVSSILLCAPYAAEKVTLVLTGDHVISELYIDMTIAMMKSFGINVEKKPNNTYIIQKGNYVNPPVYVVEPDASSATYPLALAGITGSKVTVPHIGSASLQGDAQFAVQVLGQMGCKVQQTHDTTTVEGPPMGQLKPIPHIDMEPMTDAFLTASVLAAVAVNANGRDNVTQITGIANQRVKECNRILAMITELAKFGVTATELPDGIAIHGRKIEELNPPKDGVVCYDDHRVAMSFSVLGSVVKGGTVIRERKCVEKTWPNWWDALKNVIEVDWDGFDLETRDHHFETKSSSSNGKEADVNSVALKKNSVVFIGMRGAGKTGLGKASAKALNRQFVDIDHYLESKTSTSIPDIIKNQGWDAFRKLESECLVEVVEKFSENAVIACGGGVIEAESNRAVLKSLLKTKGVPVIHVTRDIDDIVQYLGLDKSRPTWGEDVKATWERRKPFYEECSNFEFLVMNGSVESGYNWPAIEKELVKYLKFLLLETDKSVNLSTKVVSTASPVTSFLSLTFPTIQEALPVLDSVVAGTDALELRVDLLKSTDVNFVARQLALLRQHTDLPVIFTVRSKSQAGNFPDNEHEKMFGLIHHALKWGCEYIDLEITAPDSHIQKIVSATSLTSTRIIASYHDKDGSIPWNHPQMLTHLIKANQIGDIVKIISRAHSLEDNFALQTFLNTVVPTVTKKPVIALNMGRIGQLSRTLNPFYTPITHKRLPVAAAPGQLSLIQIHQTLNLLGVLPSKDFFLFGTPIQHSMSPTLHNTGFRSIGLPYTYHLKETPSVSELSTVLSDPNFGGASVTIPYKIEIIPYLDEVTTSAKRIGAVNTIYLDRKTNKKIGTNTDYIGIMNVIESKVSNSSLSGNLSALVIGAGGTARAAIHALQSLPFVCKIYIYNRTHSKAVTLATEFSGYDATQFIQPISSLTDISSLNIIVSTVPADAQSSLTFPEKIMKSENLVCVVDMAYKPRRTKILESVKKEIGVEGIDVLIEQGFKQFEIWTGMKPPKKEMSRVVYEKYNA